MRTGSGRSRSIMRLRTWTATSTSDGAALVTAVVAANVQDRDCLNVLTTGKANWPSLHLCLLNGAFTAEHCREWCNLQGMIYGIAERNREAKGFTR